MHTFSGRCSAEFQCLLYLVDVHIISGITYDFSADWYVYNIIQYFTQWEEFKNLSSLKTPKVKKQSNEKKSWDQQNMTYCAWSLSLGCPSPTAASLKFLWVLKAVFAIPSFSPGYLPQGPPQFPSLSSASPLCLVTQWVDSGTKFISIQLSAQFCPLNHSPLLPPTCPATGGSKCTL